MTILSTIRGFFGLATNQAPNAFSDPSYVLGKKAGLLADRITSVGAATTQGPYAAFLTTLEGMIEEGEFNFDKFNYGFEAVMERLYTEGFDFLFLKDKFPEKFEGRNDGVVHEGRSPAVFN
jgi:hypothetical protein